MVIGVLAILLPVLLKKLVPKWLRDLALHRIVAQSDQLAVEDLIVDDIGLQEDGQRIAVEKTDHQANNRSAKAHDILEEEHLFVLLARDLQEHKLIVILIALRQSKQPLLNQWCAILRSIALVQDASLYPHIIETSHRPKPLQIYRPFIKAPIELILTLFSPALIQIDHTSIDNPSNARSTVTLQLQKRFCFLSAPIDEICGTLGRWVAHIAETDRRVN